MQARLILPPARVVMDPILFNIPPPQVVKTVPVVVIAPVWVMVAPVELRERLVRGCNPPTTPVKVIIFGAMTDKFRVLPGASPLIVPPNVTAPTPAVTVTFVVANMAAPKIPVIVLEAVTLPPKVTRPVAGMVRVSVPPKISPFVITLPVPLVANVRAVKFVVATPIVLTERIPPAPLVSESCGIPTDDGPRKMLPIVMVAPAVIFNIVPATPLSIKIVPFVNVTTPPAANVIVPVLLVV